MLRRLNGSLVWRNLNLIKADVELRTISTTINKGNDRLILDNAMDNDGKRIIAWDVWNVYDRRRIYSYMMCQGNISSERLD